MDNQIKVAVAKHPNLTLQVNLGEIHRVIHQNIRRGSLWFEPRKAGYSVCITGEVEDLLYNFVRNNYGPPSRIHQGNKYWLVAQIDDVERIVQKYSQI